MYERIENCKIMSSSGKCLFCEIGHYFSGNTCKKCSEGCIKCPNQSLCLKCDSSYYLINQNNITFCKPNKVKI